MVEKVNLQFSCFLTSLIRLNVPLSALLIIYVEPCICNIFEIVIYTLHFNLFLAS